MTADPEDATRDAIALVECAALRDEDGIRAILRSCDHLAVTVRLVRLTVALLDGAARGEAVPCAECWRDWAAGVSRQ